MMAHFNPLLGSAYNRNSAASLDLTTGRLRVTRSQLAAKGFQSPLRRGMSEIELDPFVFFEQKGLRSQKNLSFAQMRLLRMSMPAVDSSINFIKSRMISFDFRIVKADGTRHNSFSQKRADRVRRILLKPNQFGQTYRGLLMRYLDDLLERDLGTLELAPNRIYGIDQWGVIDSFKLRPNPDHVTGDLAVAAYFETDAMDDENIVNEYRENEVVWSNFNPRSGSFYGQSPLEVLDRIILMSIYADQHNIKIVHPNSEKGGGIVWLGGVNNEVRKEFEERYQEFRKFDPGRPVFSSGGENAPVFIPIEDNRRLEWTELQQSLSEIVASVYQLQPRDIGLAGKKGAAGTAEIEDAITLKSAIIPRLLLLQDIFTTGIVAKEGGDDLKMEYIVRQDEPLEARVRAASMSYGRGVITANEFRHAYDETLEPYPSEIGDVPIIIAGNSVYRLADAVKGITAGTPQNEPEKPDTEEEDNFHRTSSKEKQGGQGQTWE